MVCGEYEEDIIGILALFARKIENIVELGYDLFCLVSICIRICF